MIVTIEKVAKLMHWFHTDRIRGGSPFGYEAKLHCPYKLMCLIVAGHQSDQLFFESLLENRAAIDTVTGDDIAMILFAPGKNKELKEVIDPVPVSGVYIPRAVLCDQNRFRQKNIEHIPIKYIPEIINRSKFVSREICRYFNIDLEDVPAILLLRKGDLAPILIPTKGEADFKIFFKFTKELNSLAKDLPGVDNLAYEFQIKQSQSRLEKKLSKKEADLLLAVKPLKGVDEKTYVILDYLTSVLSDGCNLTQDDAFELLLTNDLKFLSAILRGIASYPKLPEGSRTLFRKTFEDPEFAESFRDFRRLRRSSLNALNRVSRIEREINEIKSEIEICRQISFTDLLGKSEELRKAYDKFSFSIDELAEKYSSLFGIKAKLRPIKDFFAGFFGLAKKSKELLSLSNSIEKLLEKK